MAAQRFAPWVCQLSSREIQRSGQASDRARAHQTGPPFPPLSRACEARTGREVLEYSTGDRNELSVHGCVILPTLITVGHSHQPSTPRLGNPIITSLK